MSLLWSFPKIPVCIMHFARFWAYKTKTRSLILETLSQGNQKQTRVWRAGRGPGLEGWGCQSRFLGDFIMSSAASGVSKTVNMPLTDLSTKNIFQGQMKMTFGLSTQFGHLCHLSPFGLDNWNLHALRGMFMDESALELARGSGKDSGPGTQMKFLFWFCH